MRFIKIVTVLCVCMCWCCGTWAQNLVPNPSFETPPISGGFPTTYTDIWMNPKSTSPDYLTTGGHTGNAMAGIDIVGWSPEHVECKLNQVLIAGHKYYVSLFVQEGVEWGDHAMINCFGVHLSNNMWLDPQPLPPSVIDPGLYPGVNWVKIKGIYTAAGGEQWLTLGRMQPSFTVVIQPPGAEWGYMHVDDLCVYDMANPANYTTHDTSFCVGAFPYKLEKTSVNGHYIWSTGDTAAFINITTPGTYWRQTFLNTCSYVIDTFYIGPSTTTAATTLCAPGYPYTLQNTAVTGNYIWSSGATTAAIDIMADGIYWRKTSQGTGECGNTIDTFKVYENKLITTSHTLADCVDNMILQADTTGSTYIWSNSASGRSLTVNTTGTYWVTYAPALCTERIDTFHVWIGGHTIYVTTSKNIENCADSILLTTDSTGNAYTWNNGTSGYTQMAHASGKYWVSYYTTSICEQHRDTFNVTLGRSLSFTGDSIICVGREAKFHNASIGFGSYMWYWGDGDSTAAFDAEHVYNKAGVYQVMLVGNPCTDTIYGIIKVDSTSPVTFVADRDSVCTGQSIAFISSYGNDVVSLSWDFGDGNTYVNRQSQVYTYHNDGVYIVALTGSYAKCPDTTFKDTVHILPYPVVNIGPDTFICPNSGAITIADKVQQAPQAMYHWSTGETTVSITISEPDLYYATVSLNGCATTDSIWVQKDCYLNIPNVFSPNGDGINDYFFPREFLSHGAVRFTMQIFNRWGQMLFETHNIDGRGWDGTFNGAAQEQGVYIYLLEASFRNSASEKHQGNVTLIR